MDMFERGIRKKVRFTSGKGLATIEDLYDLPLTGNGANLDLMEQALRKEVDSEQTVSYVQKEAKTNTDAQLKLDIVRHVIDVKVAEAGRASKLALIREERQKLMGIIAEKQDEKLRGTDLDKLMEKLHKLEDALV